MIFFNHQRLEEETSNNKQLVISLYNFYKGKIIPSSIIDKYPPILGLGRGTSFLINPKELFQCTISVFFKAQIIRLAARRDYLQYKLNGDKHLDLSLFPDISTIIYKNNPLLEVTSDRIVFKTE